MSSSAAPCSVIAVPGLTVRTLGLAPPCMRVRESWRSRADSTSVVSASESWSPQGLCFRKARRYQFEKSIIPDLRASLPPPSYTQCRGKLLAPVKANADDPSARTVNETLVHANGAENWT